MAKSAPSSSRAHQLTLFSHSLCITLAHRHGRSRQARDSASCRRWATAQWAWRGGWEGGEWIRVVGWRRGSGSAVARGGGGGGDEEAAWGIGLSSLSQRLLRRPMASGSTRAPCRGTSTRSGTSASSSLCMTRLACTPRRSMSRSTTTADAHF